MDQFYAPLKEKIESYIHNADTLKQIDKAYDFAFKAHETQKRASGEPYIIHPVAVCMTLTDYMADPVTLMAALLHDTVEDTPVTPSDIEKEFGTEVKDLVIGLTKIQKISYNLDEQNNLDNNYASNFQKLLFSMTKDIRVIWVKLSDRLNNMQTLGNLKPEKQLRIATETMEVYAPIAHKLGMSKIKSELEDLSFKYLYPDDYEMVSKKINQTKKVRDQENEKILNDIRGMLLKEGIEADLSGRVKNIYSISNKMKNKGLAFENIYDLQAFRIIVDTVMDCYKILGIIHANYQPVPARFKDYIAMPKPNMYQSLHTTVVKNGRIFEIQIRTHEMDEIAESGIAAHWAYKEGTTFKKNDYEQTAMKDLRWYSDLIKYTDENSKDTSKDEVTKVFDEDILKANVYVFTPKNTVISLPEGSTVLDFAFRIHSRVGETFIGATVNGRIVPIDYQLQTGDICEIKTNKNSFGPNESWLKIAKTSSARSKIRAFLNEKNKDILISEGKDVFYQEMKNQHMDIDLTDEIIHKKFGESRSVHNLEDFFIQIGKGNIGVKFAVQAFIEDDRTNNEKIMDLINQRNKNQIYHEDIDIIVDGLQSPSVKLAHCCSPIPGDEIIGYITKGVGIAVHRTDCKNMKNLDQNRMIPVFWASRIDKRFQVDLKLTVNNRDSILADILNTSIAFNAKIIKVTARPNQVGDGIINLTVQVLNIDELNIMISNLTKIKGIYSIERVRR